MTPDQAKVTRFLEQFGSEEELAAWCRGNGVRGVPGSVESCLVSEAVKRATGLPVVLTGQRSVFLTPFADYADAISLPAVLAEMPYHFDMLRWPELEATA